MDVSEGRLRDLDFKEPLCVSQRIVVDHFLHRVVTILKGVFSERHDGVLE